jgi:COP9 signalosome complex subunit 4
MDAALSEIGNQPPASKTGAFTSLLDKTLASQSTGYDSDKLAHDLNKLISAVVQDSVGLVVSKQIVALFVKRLNEIKVIEARRTVGERTLELLQDRQASFEEQVSLLWSYYACCI